MKICLITSGVASTNPRLVKEARALADAGHEIHCVTGFTTSVYQQFANTALNHPAVEIHAIKMPSRWIYRFKRARQLLASHSTFLRTIPSIVHHALHPITDRLIAAASRIKADLYIGHTAAALPAAVIAARQHKSIAGFDIEDLHSEETDSNLMNRASRWAEDLYIRECKHITAASPQIAEWYSNRFGVDAKVILNVFPSGDGPKQSRRRLPDHPLELYWFSQTIGSGRGLEEIMKGMSVASHKTKLFLRGSVSAVYRQHLEKLASELKISAPSFEPPAHPDEMAKLAARHDIGLSLELVQPLNRDLCLTNKLFTYLTAGIPQLLSKTSAQSAISSQLGAAVRVVQLEDQISIARAIDEFADFEVWDRAACHAARLASTFFNWEIESAKLMRMVEALKQEPNRLEVAKVSA